MDMDNEQIALRMAFTRAETGAVVNAMAATIFFLLSELFQGKEISYLFVTFCSVFVISVVVSLIHIAKVYNKINKNELGMKCWY